MLIEGEKPLIYLNYRINISTLPVLLSAFKIYFLLSPDVVNFSDNESKEPNSTPILSKGYLDPLGTSLRATLTPPPKKNYEKV